MAAIDHAEVGRREVGGLVLEALNLALEVDDLAQHAAVARRQRHRRQPLGVRRAACHGNAVVAPLRAAPCAGELSQKPVRQRVLPASPCLHQSAFQGRHSLALLGPADPAVLACDALDVVLEDPEPVAVACCLRKHGPQPPALPQ